MPARAVVEQASAIITEIIESDAISAVLLNQFDKGIQYVPIERVKEEERSSVSNHIGTIQNVFIDDLGILTVCHSSGSSCGDLLIQLNTDQASLKTMTIVISKNSPLSAANVNKHIVRPQGNRFKQLFDAAIIRILQIAGTLMLIAHASTIL